TPPFHRFSSRTSRAKSQLLHSGQQVWMMDKFTVEDKVKMLEPFDLSVYVVVKQPAGRQFYCDAYCVKGKMQLGRQSTKFCCMLIDKQGNIGFPEHYFFVTYK
nr:hypothetical protein [Tanacetum cinerariifolium]